MSKCKLNIVTGVDNLISYNNYYLYTQCGHHGLNEQVLFLSIITSQCSHSNFKQFKIIIIVINIHNACDISVTICSKTCDFFLKKSLLIL